MYARRILYKNQWSYVVQRSKYFPSSNCRDYSVGQCLSPAQRANSLNERYISSSSLFLGQVSGRCCTILHWRSGIGRGNCPLRSYSSEGDGGRASEDKCVPNKDVVDYEKEKIDKEDSADNGRHRDAHARLGEQDQMEWLKNEKLALENKKKESLFLNRRERFRNEILRKIVPWEKITVSLQDFPYYLHEDTKNLLLECTASHLRHKKVTTDFGGRLTSSSGRILLQSIPGTELYRERLVRALARDLKVPILVLDGSGFVPHDFNEDESESDDDNSECASESEDDASNEEDYSSSSEARTDGSDDEAEHKAAEVLRNISFPCTAEELEKAMESVSGECESSSTASKLDTSVPPNNANRPLKKGDPVKYIGHSVCIEADNRTISNGQRGEVYEVNGDLVGVVFNISDKTKEDSKDEKSAEPTAKSSICWLHVKDIELDADTQTQDCFVAMEALGEVLASQKPLVVYFSDSSPWLSKAVPKSSRNEFFNKMQEMFDQLSGPLVLICGQNKEETGDGSGSKVKEKVTMMLPIMGRLTKSPLMKILRDGLRSTKRSGDDEIYKLFTNVMYIDPPKEEDLLTIFNKQIEEDRKIVISRSNLSEMHKVLEEHDLSCIDLLHVNTNDVVLTRGKAEKVVGWAKNNYLSSCPLPLVKGDRLQIPRESLERVILRLEKREAASKKPSQILENLAKDEYERNFVSAVVPPGEIGVKFDDVGALEDVKKALHELVILPMRRPELFSRGNLLRPCKGILLFGPPGTGKTLLAKALATEAQANFISITGSTLTSKWFGDAEKLTKALFSFASRLAPVIIFVDEVDSLLGARGGASEHEATRRMRNEFMAAWDGLRSKDNHRILILGATNRPFDLDDAVIRRLPRRIYVDLPDAANRQKILKIILAPEKLESGFSFEQLANATEGYSGSDLKNLCIAAAYRPVQELLEEESKGCKSDGVPVLRPLKLDDFTQSKTKVGPSVAFDAASMNELRKWNEQYGEGGSRRKSPFGF